MVQCPAIKANGERCKGDAVPGAEWCYSHDPDRAEQRRRNASRGGRAGGRGRGGELADIKALLADLTDRVLGGEGVEPVETGRAAVANQLLNTRLRAVEVERKIKETEELEARIEELEQAAEGGAALGSIGKRLEGLEEASRRSAVADIRRAWGEMSDEEMALVLGPYYFRREPTAEEADAASRSRAKLPEGLIARAVDYREGMGGEELGRRMGEIMEPVVNSRRWAVLRCLRLADEGGRA